MKLPSYVIWIGIIVIGVGLLSIHYITKDPSQAPGEKEKKSTEQVAGTDKPGTESADDKTHGGTTPETDPDVNKKAPAATSGPATTQGQVLTYEQNSPIPDARISFCATKEKKQYVSYLGVTNLQQAKPQPLTSPTTTDQNGYFAFPEDDLQGTCSVYITAQGFAPLTKEITLPPQQDIKIRLRKGGRLIASGLNSAGIPVVAASRSGLVKLELTNENGETVFENLPFDDWCVLVGDPFMEGTVSPETISMYTFPHSLTPANSTVTVDLSYCVQVSGQIPELNGGEILLRSTDGRIYFVRRSTLDSDGAFLFPYVLPGEYELIVRPRLGTAYVAAISLEKGMKDKDMGTITFALCSFSGVVLHQEKTIPIPDLRVRLNSDRGTGTIETKTDENGAFSFAGVAPGPYHIIVGSDTPDSRPVTKQVSLIAGLPVEKMTIAYSPASP